MPSGHLRATCDHYKPEDHARLSSSNIVGNDLQQAFNKARYTGHRFMPCPDTAVLERIFTTSAHNPLYWDLRNIVPVSFLRCFQL